MIYEGEQGSLGYFCHRQWRASAALSHPLPSPAEADKNMSYTSVTHKIPVNSLSIAQCEGQLKTEIDLATESTLTRD